MRVFLFSPTGNVGSRMFEQLKNAGHEVFIKTRNECTLEGKVDVCIYTAGVTAGRQETAAKYIIDNCTTSVEIVSLCKRNDIGKILYLSSDEVYGDLITNKLEITAEKKNLNAYAMTKMLSEEVVIESGIPYRILRLPGIVGGITISNTYLVRIIKKARLGEDIEAYNLDNYFNNVVHVDDLCNFVVEHIEDDFRNEILNLGQIEKVRLCDLISYVIKKTNSSSRIIEKGVGKRYFTLPCAEAIECGYSSRGVYNIIDDIVEKI